MPGPSEAAEAALAAHLTADRAVSATVVAGAPDALRPSTLTVETADVEWMPYRWLCTMVVTGYVRYQRTSQGDTDITDLMDAAVTSVLSMRSGVTAHWLGPGSDLGYTEAGTVEADGKRYASSELTVVIAVKRLEPREVGESEQAVRDFLGSVGFPVLDASDEPPFTITRWGGSAAEDPSSDEIMVQCATEVESGQIEEYVRARWKALYTSRRFVVNDQLDVAPIGTPYGSNGLYEVGQIMLRVLNPREIV